MATSLVAKCSIAERLSARCGASAPFRSAMPRRCVRQLRGARTVTNIAMPMKDAEETAATWHVTLHAPVDGASSTGLPELVTRETVRALEAELDQSAAMAALRRFNRNLRNVPADKWEMMLRPVFNELCFNLESFNPAFAACLLMVQQTIGESDYERRDRALKNLIQPLAGEYGMENGHQQGATHRELFSSFFQSLFGYSLASLMDDSPRPAAAEKLYSQMMRDILSGGGHTSAMEKASYALGYNLAIEYLADPEKTWMLDSFKDLDQQYLQDMGKDIDWKFLDIHAKGEVEHAAIGHTAVLSLIPACHTPILRQAMHDHARDFAAFYNHIADMLEC